MDDTALEPLMVQTIISGRISMAPYHAGGIVAAHRDTGDDEQNGRMDLGLRDRVYLVTGGSRGLGFAAAQALVADGARVLLSAPHESTAAAAVARLVQDAAPGAAAWLSRITPILEPQAS
jgi:short chain dehydrogenase